MIVFRVAKTDCGGRTVKVEELTAGLRKHECSELADQICGSNCTGTQVQNKLK